jgi:hypothetical protein
MAAWLVSDPKAVEFRLCDGISIHTNALEELQTGDGHPLPEHLKVQDS